MEVPHQIRQSTYGILKGALAAALITSSNNARAADLYISYKVSDRGRTIDTPLVESGSKREGTIMDNVKSLIQAAVFKNVTSSTPNVKAAKEIGESFLISQCFDGSGLRMDPSKGLKRVACDPHTLNMPVGEENGTGLPPPRKMPLLVYDKNQSVP